MQDNLSERLRKVEKDIAGLKAIQKTQNDSYKFYVYQSENLYNKYPLSTTLTVEFRPFVLPKERVFCSFFLENGLAVQFYDRIYVDGSNPLKGTFTPETWTYETPPSFICFDYVGCLTNCEGQLIIST